MSLAADSDPFELPLFPLQTVLFPGGPLALRIFEPRYLDMIANCLRTGRSFGVIAIRRGTEVGPAETFDVGTTAEIVDWHREAGGLLGVAAVGRRRFRLASKQRRADGLYVGSAVWLEHARSGPLPERFAALAKLLREVASVTAEHVPDDDAEWVGLRLAEALPLPIPVKQSLLEIEQPVERLERLTAILYAARRAE